MSTTDEIQSDPSTPMSAMYARSGVRVGIPYETELRGVRPEIRAPGTRVFLGCTVLLIWVGGAIGRSSSGLLLVARRLVSGYRPFDRGRNDPLFFLDLSVFASPVPALGPGIRSDVTWPRAVQNRRCLLFRDRSESVPEDGIRPTPGAGTSRTNALRASGDPSRRGLLPWLPTRPGNDKSDLY